METFIIDGNTYKRIDAVDGDIVTVVREGQDDLKVGQTGKLMGLDRVIIDESEYTFSTSVFAKLVLLTPEEKEEDDNYREETRIEMEALVSDYVDLCCNDYDMSKEGVINLTNYMGNVLLEKIRKKGRMNPVKEIAWAKMQGDMIKKLDDRKYGSGKHDTMVLLMFRKLFNRKDNAQA